MSARFAVGRFGFLSSALLWLTVFATTAPKFVLADEPGQTAEPAKAAEALAGKLVRTRPEQDRKDGKDLLNQLDLARDVVYTTAESPVPEGEQFQFVDGVLRTPEKGDARLCLPIEVPRYYRLALDLVRKDEAADPSIGIGVVMDGQQFFAAARMSAITLFGFYGKTLTLPVASRDPRPIARGPQGTLELTVGDIGLLLRNRAAFLEWLAPASAFSLDEAWAIPAKDKLFLVFPDGQFDIRSITLEPLAQPQWAQQAVRFMPEGAIATAIRAQGAPVNFDVEPIPDLDGLRPTVMLQAYRGNFDELERWADRLRSGEVMIEEKFASEPFYTWLTTAYVSPIASGTRGKIDGFYQAELAFADAWLKQKPDSVAARIVKAKAYFDYAWDIRGAGFAGEVPRTAWQPFKERLQNAEEILKEASRLKPPDVCVFSSLLGVGTGLGWNHEQLDRAVERGLLISKKDPVLIDMMANQLLPRWGGEPGDLGKFALRISERIKGEDGAYLYGRIARYTQVAEVSLKRNSGDPEAFARTNRDYTDPQVVLKEFSAEQLRAAAAALHKRHPKAKRTLNFVCWLYCVLDDRETAKEHFAEIVDKPDVSIWGSRDLFDHWRRWCDETVPEPSQFLPIEGKELAHLRPYSVGATKIQFLLDNQTLATASTAPASAIKFWNLSQKTITDRFEPPENLGNLVDLWVLDNGNLYAPMFDGKRPVTVQYLAPNYSRSASYPALYGGGLPFNLISDDAEVGGVMNMSQVLIVNAKLKKQKTFRVPPARGATLGPAGQYLIAYGDKIRVWDALEGNEVLTIDVQPKLHNYLRDGTGIVYTTDDKLVVWDIASNRERFSFPTDARRQVEALGSPLDGRFLATAERLTDADGTGERHIIALYDLKQPEPALVLGEHKTSILALAISHDCSRLASSSLDGIVKVWDLGAFGEKKKTDDPASR
jgi:WD40 repeat protein